MWKTNDKESRNASDHIHLFTNLAIVLFFKILNSIFMDLQPVQVSLALPVTAGYGHQWRRG